MSDHPQVLVATLGGQPQVITFTLDLLLRQGYPVSEVIVLHPRASSPSRLYDTVMRLHTEFTGGAYPGAQQPIHFHSQHLTWDDQPIDDITDDTHADGTLDTIHRLLSDLKQQGYRIHLSVTGGRRLMSLLAISVATLNFDRYDRIWHLYTPDAVVEKAKDGRLLHVAPDAGVKLIQAPFLSLGSYLSHSTQPFRRAQEEQRVQLEAQEHKRCQEVIDRATPTQRKVLQAFARGLWPQQVAEELCVALVTVNTHKTALLSYCRNAWNISDRVRLDYHFLSSKFSSYYQSTP